MNFLKENWFKINIDFVKKTIFSVLIVGIFFGALTAILEVILFIIGNGTVKLNSFTDDFLALIVTLTSFILGIWISHNRLWKSDDKSYRNTVLLLVGILGLGILSFELYLTVYNNVIVKLNKNPEPQVVSNTTRFYIKSAIANVRECPSTDCKVLVRYFQNSWWDFPSTAHYNTVNDMPDWVSVGWSDEKGNSGDGYINKSNFSDTPIVVNPSQTQQQNYSIKTQDLPSIIKRWRPLIAYIECTFTYTTGETYLVQSGSGTLGGYIHSNDILIFTNKHVVTDNNGYYPDSCTVKLPDHDKVFYIPYGNTTRFNDYDFATIKIPSPDDYVKSLVNSTKEKIFCLERPPVGAQVVILGYPGVGSQTDITATEGIISGYDNNYYITSAKVEHGNSGGAAIRYDFTNNQSCNLGVPSFATIGTVESLARILSWDKIIILNKP